MKPYPTLRKYVAAIALFTAFVGLAIAQDAPSTEDTASYKIDKIEPALIDSPEINAGNYSKKTKAKAKWLEIDLGFERIDKKSPSFSGEVVVSFFILLNNAATQPEKKPTLLTGSITLSDIPAAKNLHAAAFVSPQMLDKLFAGKPPASISQAIIDLGATITADSKIVAIKTLKGTVVGDKGWWDSDTASMTTITGLVLEKEKTPFSNLSWDYYLPAKISR